MKTIAIILTILVCAAAQDLELYKDVVYMAQHRIGNDLSNKIEQNALLSYLQVAFGINDTMHQKILLDANDMQAPVVHLNVEVIEAKELMAKDSNGKSDPFCTLYLELTPEQRNETKVKLATLTPVWEEDFQLESKHADEDALCLEVWDYDPAETIMEKLSKAGGVSGIKGLYKLAREIPAANRPSVEFIGRCRINLKDIPLTGHEMWYPLGKSGGLQIRGSVHLRLAFVTKHDLSGAIQEHRKLLVALSLSEVKKEPKYFWNGRFPAIAEAIILQHRARRGLSARNAELSRWAAFASVHQTQPMHFAVFERLAGKLIRSIAAGDFSRDEHALFWEGALKMLHSCFETISGIEVLGNGKRTVAEQLEAIFGIISAIWSVEVPEDLELLPIATYDWLPESSATEIDLPQVLKHQVIKRGNLFWDRALQNNAEMKASDQDAVEYRLKIISSVMAELKRARETYDGIFIEKANFSYARILYITFEKRLCNFDMIIVQDVCRRLNFIRDDNIDITELTLGNKLFELYKNIQSFVEYGKRLRIDDPGNTRIFEYHGWFKPCIRHWVNNVVIEAHGSIGTEILNRTVGHLESVANSNVLFYPCAIDVTIVLNAMKIFWDELAWPNVEESLKYLGIIIRHASRCSIIYADNISIESENKEETESEESDESTSARQEAFQVPPIWCAAINGIDRVKTSIVPWKKHPALQDINNSGDDENQRKANRQRRNFTRTIEDTIDVLDDKIEELLRLIADEMAPAMEEYLRDSAEMFDATNSNDFTDRLLYYINDNIEILHKNLNEDSFRRIAVIVWKRMLEMLYQLVKSNLKEDRPPAFYSNLHATLNVLLTGFSSLLANDCAVNLRLLEKIQRLLIPRSAETVESTHRHSIEQTEEEEDSIEPIAGILTVRAHFVGNLLSVEISNATDLSALDANGRNDTFVKLRLLPEEKFKEVATTHVQNNALDPAFNRVLEMHLTGEQKSLEDAILVFEIMQKTDSVKTKFLAEAFLQFSEIPDVTHEPPVESLEKQLRLYRPGNTALNLVETPKYRKNDEEAEMLVYV